MKLLKRKSISFGIVGLFVVFSIVFILRNLQIKNSAAKMNHSEKNGTIEKSMDVEDSKKVEYTLNGLPKDIIKYMDSNRITSDLSMEEMKKEFKKYLYNHYTSWEDGLDKIPKDNEMKSIDSEPFFNPGAVFTYEEVEEDVNYLFTNLKYGYAGYQYFGGDEKFNKTKNKILEELKGSESKFGEISAIDFNKILMNNLRFIKDGHFEINTLKPIKNTYAFINKDEMIIKDNNRFYIKKGNKKYPIISIEGNDPINYIKPSIDEDGKIVYKIICLKEITNKSWDINITIKDKEEVQKKITLKKIASSPSLLGNKAYSFEEIEGIPVFKVFSFSKPLEQFSEDGLKYADKKIAILDLRGNEGGGAKSGLKWISNFTNNNVTDLNHINASLVTEISKKRYLNKYNLLNLKIDESQKDDHLRNSSHMMGWGKISTPKLEKLKNDKVIIVLFDKDSASASEAMISKLNYMENVIFIGTNSYGALNITATGINILPNSKLRVIGGKDISMEPDFIWRDGVGYFPDFWIEPKDALNRTIKFINSYIKH